MTTPRRPLEEMIGDLADGMLAMRQIGAPTGLRATSLELTLPVETRVARGAGGLRVEADMPRTHTRTWFDLPVGRLVLRLGEMPTASMAEAQP